MMRKDEREAAREKTKQGRFFNTIKPSSPDVEWHFKEYVPLCEPDPGRDGRWSDLHDCIMANIFHQLNKWATQVDVERPETIMKNPFEHVRSCGMFVERATAMALRATEEWMDRHGYNPARTSPELHRQAGGSESEPRLLMDFDDQAPEKIKDCPKRPK